ncbi:MAG: hypothetical protein JNN07_21990 [Verrucomicrobiales bacterium]|nr:hypothetical protein [Verrucomicrobiales bacterium]
MEIKTLEETIVIVAESYSKKFKIPLTRTYIQSKLYEEIGELAQALMVYDELVRPEKRTSREAAKEMVAKELADVIGMAFLTAHLLGVDMEKAFTEKWVSYLPSPEASPSLGSDNRD